MKKKILLTCLFAATASADTYIFHKKVYEGDTLYLSGSACKVTSEFFVPPAGREPAHTLHIIRCENEVVAADTEVRKTR